MATIPVNHDPSLPQAGMVEGCVICMMGSIWVYWPTQVRCKSCFNSPIRLDANLNLEW